MISCTASERAVQKDIVVEAKMNLVSQGRVTYQTNCIACHNMNPAKDGSLGPAIKNSSLELITARVLKAEYPPKYNPKRNSKLMQPMPQLENKLHALYEFLNSPN
ncbi:MAG: cytochrome c [Bdellovibrionales bacterium]|nr:cytochrome c [Bdellovibrionales bacterium]